MYKTYLEKLENLKDKELKNTELKAEKIELGLVDDALERRKAVAKFGKEIDTDEKNIKEFSTGLKYWTKTTKTDIELLDKYLKELKTGMKAIETSAKDLGLKANSIPEYKDAIEVVKYGEKQLQKGKKLLK
jgi:exonuclease VII small subunit